MSEPGDLDLDDEEGDGKSDRLTLTLTPRVKQRRTRMTMTATRFLILNPCTRVKEGGSRGGRSGNKIEDVDMEDSEPVELIIHLYPGRSQKVLSSSWTIL